MRLCSICVVVGRLICQLVRLFGVQLIAMDGVIMLIMCQKGTWVQLLTVASKFPRLALAVSENRIRLNTATLRWYTVVIIIVAVD